MDPASIALIISSILGGALGGRAKTSTVTQTMDPAFKPLQDAILHNVINKQNNPSALPPQYETGGISDINQVYRTLAGSTENDLTRRGLADSPVAGVVAGNMNAARGGEIARFQGSIPLLNQQLQNQDLSQAMQAFSLGKPSQTTTGPSNILGGATDDLGTALGYILRQNQLKTMQTRPGAIS